MVLLVLGTRASIVFLLLGAGTGVSEVLVHLCIWGGLVCLVSVVVVELVVFLFMWSRLVSFVCMVVLVLVVACMFLFLRSRLEFIVCVVVVVLFLLCMLCFEVVLLEK